MDLIAAELVHRLGRQPDIAHHRHAGIHDGPNRILHGDAAFELDRLRAGFLEKTSGIVQRLSC